MNQLRNYILKVTGFFFLSLQPFTCLSGQDKAVDEMLLTEIKALLGKYEYLASNIRQDAMQDPVRPFIQLFRNPRVLVYDDLVRSIDPVQTSIRDYAGKILDEFPGGLDVRIDTSRLKVKYVRDEQQSRRMVEVKVNKKISGVSDGQDFTRTINQVFRIGYEIIENEPVNFLIHGIQPVSVHDHELSFKAAPGLSRIYNAALIDNNRFEIPWKASWRTSVRYQYMFNYSWGIGAGLGGILVNHELHLDKFDPLRGRDPNIRNISWETDLYYLEMPVYGIYRIRSTGRLGAEAHLGVYTAYRVFENISASGRNFHTGKVMEGIVTDPFNYENISILDAGLEISLSITYSISGKAGIFAGIGLRHGMLTLDKDTGKDYPYSIYQGQFNPQFYEPGVVNLIQVLPAQIGLSIKLSGENILNKR